MHLIIITFIQVMKTLVYYIQSFICYIYTYIFTLHCLVVIHIYMHTNIYIHKLKSACDSLLMIITLFVHHPEMIDLIQ